MPANGSTLFACPKDCFTISANEFSACSFLWLIADIAKSPDKLTRLFIAFHTDA
jgi:hypothetical protein